ncbi:hypothetical protein PCE1_000414 [Barthelona sp. PCE]
MLGFYFVIPLLPEEIDKLDGGEFVYGAVFAIYALFAALSSYIFGRISVSYGVRKMFTICLIGLTIAVVFHSFANSIPAHAASRAGQGCFSAIMALSFTYCSLVAAEDDVVESQLMSYLNGVSSLAGLIGPLAATWLYTKADKSFMKTLWIAAVIMLISAIYSFFFLKEPMKIVTPKHSSSDLMPPIREPVNADEYADRVDDFMKEYEETRTALRHVLIIAYCCLWGILSSVESLVGIWLYEIADTDYYSKTIAIAAVSTFIVQAFIVPPVVKAWGIMRVALTASLMMIIPAYFSFHTEKLVVRVSLAAATSSFAFCSSTVTVMIGRTSNDKGKIFGSMQAFVWLARWVFPTFGGFLLEIDPYILGFMIIFVGILALFLLIHVQYKDIKKYLNVDDEAHESTYTANLDEVVVTPILPNLPEIVTNETVEDILERERSCGPSPFREQDVEEYFCNSEEEETEIEDCTHYAIADQHYSSHQVDLPIDEEGDYTMSIPEQLLPNNVNPF